MTNSQILTRFIPVIPWESIKKMFSQDNISHLLSIESRRGGCCRPISSYLMLHVATGCLWNVQWIDGVLFQHPHYPFGRFMGEDAVLGTSICARFVSCSSTTNRPIIIPLRRKINSVFDLYKYTLKMGVSCY